MSLRSRAQEAQLLRLRAAAAEARTPSAGAAPRKPRVVGSPCAAARRSSHALQLEESQCRNEDTARPKTSDNSKPLLY